MKRNQYLTEGMLAILQMVDKSEDKELAQSIPGGWWVENQEVDGRCCTALLRLGLLHQEQSSDTFIRYTINEDGRGCMTDPKYVPKIIGAVREGKLKL